jgi:hypothetical protein
MELTKKWLEEKNACDDGITWFEKAGTATVEETVEKLLTEEKYDWANWLLPRCLTKEQNVKYAIHAAEMVLPIYEKKYPDDMRPRQAIDAAKSGTPAWAAGEAAWAAEAARAAGAAAWAAAWAAGAAAWAAEAAGAAAWAAARAAGAAAWAAEAAARAAEADIYKKIITYGLDLIKEAA